MDEQLERYPPVPIDPAYYLRVLSVVSDMTSDEMDARALFHARPETARGGVGGEQECSGRTGLSEGQVALDIEPALNQELKQVRLSA